MPIDPSIALGVKPIQLESPLNQLGQVFQLQGAQQANQLNRLKMDEYDRGVARQNQLRTLLGGLGDVPDEKRVSALRGGGYFDEADKLETGLLARQKTGTEVSERNLKIAKDRYASYQQELRALYGDPMLTKEKAAARAKALEAAGILTPELSASLVASLPDNPAELKDHIAIGLKSQLNPEQLLTAFAPKPTEINSGQQKFFRDTNPNSPTYGQMTGGAAVQLQASPESVMTDARARSEGAAGRAVTMRGQDLTDARQRDANTIKTGEKKATEDLTKGSQIASFETMLGTLDRLGAHPGLSRSVGVVGAFPTMPGSESANFQAELNSFQSQAFIPMVSQLKGMGALSDAEGKKLTQAVGALDPKMGEKAFRESVARIKSDMEGAYARVAGKPRDPETPPGAGPKVGTVENGYRFKGGNPSDPKSWEKV